MLRRLVPLVILALSVPALASAAAPQAGNPQRSQRMANAVSRFERAFYDLTPHKRHAEASREFDLAVTEFEAELRERPSSAEAHKYLARIFTVRKQFREAARHYDDLTALDPSDVDALAFSAAAWADAGEFAEARVRLLKAKELATDPAAIERLDEYLGKLDGRGPAQRR